MLKFRSLADGDCLYNSEAVSLIQAFLQGKLNPLFKKPAQLAQFHRLLKTFEAHDWVEVADEITEQSVKDGFNALIAAFTDNKQIQWISLQQHLSVALREFVVESILTDPVTKNAVKTELHRTINQCIDMAYVNGVLVENLEIEGINGGHFDGMEVIENKIAEILMDDTLSTADQKKDALRAWFFAGEETGLNEYLQGEQSIGNVAVFAGEVEMKVLSHKFGIVHKTCWRGAEKDERAARYYNGFRSPEESRKVAKGALVFSFEKTPNHWNCLLPATAANRKMLQLYNAQLSKEDAQNIIEEILVQHDSFASHHATELSDLSIQEYCKLYGITQKQYDNPEAEKKKIIAESKPENNQPANHQTHQTSGGEDLQISIFTKYFILTAAAIGFFSHCVIMPFLTPLFSSMLMGTFLMANLPLLTFAMTVALSGIGGYLIAQKLTEVKPTTFRPVSATDNAKKSGNAQNQDNSDKAEVDKSKKAKKSETEEDVIDVDKPKPVLAGYNTRAQSRRAAQEEAANESSKPSRRVSQKAK